MSDMIPLIASAADLPDAIRYAQTRPTARWYVAKQAVALGAADLIPADWRVPITAASQPGDLSQDARDEAADAGEALPDGSFPIRNTDELAKAVQALGRANDPDRAKRHIIKCARKLGALDKLPEAWGITASAAELVAEDTDATVELDALVAASAGREGEHLAGDLSAAWDEALHPRGRDGKWITRGGKIDVYNLDDSHRPALQATAEGVHNDPKLGMVITARVTTPGSYQGTEHQVGDSIQVLPKNIEQAPEARAHLDAQPALGGDRLSGASGPHLNNGDRVAHTDGRSGTVVGIRQSNGQPMQTVQWKDGSRSEHTDGQDLTPTGTQGRLPSRRQPAATPVPETSDEHTEANNFGFPAQHKVTPVTHADGRAQLHVEDTTQADPRFASTARAYDVGSPDLDQARQQANHDYAPDAPARISVQHATRSGGTETEEWRKNKTGTYDLYQDGRKSGFSNFTRSQVEARGEHTPLDIKGNPIEQAAPAGLAEHPAHQDLSRKLQAAGLSKVDADEASASYLDALNPDDFSPTEADDEMVDQALVEHLARANGGGGLSQEQMEHLATSVVDPDKYPEAYGALADEFDAQGLGSPPTFGGPNGSGGGDTPELPDGPLANDPLRTESTWQPGDPTPANDRDYATAMLSMADGYQQAEVEDGAQDDRLDAMTTHLIGLLKAGDDKAAGDYADQIAKHIDDEYGVDDGDLPERPSGSPTPGGAPGSDGPTGGDSATSLLAESEDPDTFLADRGGSDQVDNAGMLSGVATEFEQAGDHPDTTPEQRAQLADRLAGIADRDAESHSYFDGEALGLSDEETAQAEREQQQAQQRAEQVVAKLRGNGDAAPGTPNNHGPNGGGGGSTAPSDGGGPPDPTETRYQAAHQAVKDAEARGDQLSDDPRDVAAHNRLLAIREKAFEQTPAGKRQAADQAAAQQAAYERDLPANLDASRRANAAQADRRAEHQATDAATTPDDRIARMSEPGLKMIAGTKSPHAGAAQAELDRRAGGNSPAAEAAHDDVEPQKAALRDRAKPRYQTREGRGPNGEVQHHVIDTQTGHGTVRTFKGKPNAAKHANDLNRAESPSAQGAPLSALSDEQLSRIVTPTTAPHTDVERVAQETEGKAAQAELDRRGSAAEPRKAALRAKVSESQQQRLRDQGQANWNNHVQHQERAETARRKAKGLDENGNATRPISTSIASNQLRVAGHKSAGGEGGGTGFRVQRAGDGVAVELRGDNAKARQSDIVKHFSDLGYDAQPTKDGGVMLNNRRAVKTPDHEPPVPSAAAPSAPMPQQPSADAGKPTHIPGVTMHGSMTDPIGAEVRKDGQRIGRIEDRRSSTVDVMGRGSSARLRVGSKKDPHYSVTSVHKAWDKRPLRSRGRSVKQALDELNKIHEQQTQRAAGVPSLLDTGAPSAPVGDLTDSQRVNRLVTMHGSDRSKWSGANLRLAAKAGDQQAKDELESRLAAPSGPPDDEYKGHRIHLRRVGSTLHGFVDGADQGRVPDFGAQAIYRMRRKIDAGDQQAKDELGSRPGKAPGA